jgi:hypothetical protein
MQEGSGESRHIVFRKMMTFSSPKCIEDVEIAWKGQEMQTRSDGRKAKRTAGPIYGGSDAAGAGTLPERTWYLSIGGRK